jgi:NAD(P)-dependent dehydrogenase (short-subunit alcohol dehydrogenase family)
MLRVHLDGGFYLAQPAYRMMKAQGYGRFVFIASSAGVRSRREAGRHVLTISPTSP